MDHEMSTPERLRMHHAQTLWMYWMLVILGCWLLMILVIGGVGDAGRIPSGQHRGLLFTVAALAVTAGALLTYPGHLRPSER